MLKTRMHDLELSADAARGEECLDQSPSLAGVDRELLEGAVFSGLTIAEQKAIAITSTLETGKRGGFSGLSGNFDGMGISFGLVNWNIGAGSLQNLLRDFLATFPTRWKSVFGPHAESFAALVRPKDRKAIAAQLAFAISEMNVKVEKKWHVKEPWKGYFARLAADTEFQKIQVRFVRNLLERADYFCRYFSLRSERAFCFMFDAVASHGKWWLTKEKNGVQQRRLLLKNKLVLLQIPYFFGDVPEDATLNAVAETLRDTSLDRWKERVYARKSWFLTGKHPREKELRGLEPRPNVPYALSASTAPTTTSKESEWELELPGPEDAASTRVFSKLLASGERNPDHLANEAFYLLHPERNRRPIQSHEQALAKEWRALRSGFVARLVRPTRGGTSAVARKESAAIGTTHYVELPLGVEGDARPLTGIFIPEGYRYSADADVILYLHGHKAGHYSQGSAMAIDRYWNERTSPRAALREAAHESGKNTILVAPTLGPKSQAHTLATAGGLDDYLTRVMKALAAQAGWQGRAAPRLRHLILAAHSGGGIWMLSMANGQDRAIANLRECWGFDCFYHPSTEIAGWPAWARKYPDKTLFAYDATDSSHKGRLIGPRTVANALRGKRIANLIATPARKQGDHFGVLRDHFRERIALSRHLEPR